MVPQKLPSPKYIPKHYEQMIYPGQHVQIDVKHVPFFCIINDARVEKFYQYNTINKYSRWCYSFSCGPL